MRTPPPTRRGDTVDELFGQRVADPYRWLEDLDGAETAGWVREQAEYAEEWLAGVPEREELRVQLTALWDRPTCTVPFCRGGRWFQWRNTGLQQQPVLWTGPAPDDLERVLLDPNTLSDDGTVAVGSVDVSRDGALLAWSSSESGSDWQTFRVREIATGADRDDVLRECRFSEAAWLPDGSGFYYNAPVGNVSRVLLHVLGTPQAEDVVVFATPDEPEWFHAAHVTDDGRWTVVAVNEGTGEENQLWVRPAGADGDFTAVVPDMATTAYVVDSDADSLTLFTNDSAERGRVVRLSLANPGRGHWAEVVPESDATLLGVSAGHGLLVCQWLRDGCGEVTVHDAVGGLVTQLPLPEVTAVTEVSFGDGSHLLHVQTASAVDPGTVWQHDTTSAETRVLRRTPLDVGDLVQERFFVESFDGTRLPVFLTRRADVAATGDVPAVLYGYGGFSIPIPPAFSPVWALWARRGGVFVSACLRGGGEYGRAWHDAGRLQHKENVFDDACAVAAWLHAQGWSAPERTAVTGRSNGGLLAAACLLRHPELFGAAVPEVGVHDMLRFHLFTIGWAWKSDYGDPEIEADFQVLQRYSPLHTVVPGRGLPPVLVTTGDHDDRVVPSHSFKLAATLQASRPENLTLLRVDIAAGHGAGKPTAKLVAERADVLAFLTATLRQP